jgi:hypothetical protein
MGIDLRRLSRRHDRARPARPGHSRRTAQRPVQHVCAAGKGLLDKAFRSLLLAYGIRAPNTWMAGTSRDKPGHDVFKAGVHLPRNALKMVPQPGRPTGPDSIAFVVAKTLARLDLSLRHGGCGKQKLG